MAFARISRIKLSVGQEVSFTTLAMSTTFDGVTFNFDREMPVGTFVTGEPFVVSDRPFAITSITPTSGDLQGDGYVGNGAMLNPLIGDAQGFDAYLGDFPTKPTAQMEYAPAANVDPAVNGSIAFGPGQSASVVKSVRAPTKTSTEGWAVISKYVVLTVLDDVPPENSYRPGIAGATKRLRSRADVDFTPRNIPLPPSWPSVPQIMSDVPDTLSLFVTSGEKRRLLRVDTYLGTASTGYSAEITDNYARFIYAANSSNVSEAQRQQIVDRIITLGNDLEAVIDTAELGYGGNFRNRGAGQGGGLWLWGMAAAALLKDDALHQKIRAERLQPDTAFWVSETDVGLPVSGKAGVAAQTYFEEHVGKPWLEPDEAGSHHAGRYTAIAAGIFTWEYASILAFNQAPGALTNGRDMILNGGANDETNQFAAGLNFASRFRTWNKPIMSAGPSGPWQDAWDDLLAVGAVTEWSGAPDQPPTGNSSAWRDPYFAPGGAGAIVLNTQGVDFATEPVTRVDFRYSLDGVQWVEDNDVSFGTNVFIKDGLLRGAMHHCGWRRHSSSGASPWSQNHPYATPIESEPLRGMVMTTGSETASAPVSTVAPIVHARAYAAWDFPVWTPRSGPLSVDDVELAAGLGYWSGYPAPVPETDFSFQWTRNGNAIEGATTQTYRRVAADADATLACTITCVTASGSATVTTAAVLAPSIQTPPTGVLIDTDFRGAFAIDYEPELLSATGTNYEIVHLPTIVPIAEGESVGALHFDKIGGSPSGFIQLSRATEANQSYSISAEIAYGGSKYSSRGDFIFSIETPDGQVLFSNTTDGDAVEFSPTGNLLVNVEGVFQSATSSVLRVKIAWPNSTGGGSGGDPYLTSLNISKA